VKEDWFTHTEANAAAYERERAINAGEDDRPTLDEAGW
jgi:hypothetical protein